MMKMYITVALCFVFVCILGSCGTKESTLTDYASTVHGKVIADDTDY